MCTREQYKEAGTVAMAMQSQLALSFSAGAADMLNKTEEHIKKYYGHIHTCIYMYMYMYMCTCI